MRLRTRLGALAASLLLMVGGLVAFSAAPASAHCGGHGTHPDRYSAGGIDWANGTRIRSQPHNTCTIRGLGYRSHGIDVHCLARTGALWVYARNTTTGVNGWSREDALYIPNPTFVPYCVQSASGNLTSSELEGETIG